MTINNFNNIFFIGIAGTGMSAIAQYLQGIGKNVSGSDRYFQPETYNETKEKLEVEGILCFLQDGSGITEKTDLVVVSTAIEDTVFEVKKAKELNIPILKRSQVLALISESKKTIAVGGTSGKSTTSAMIFDILQYAGLEPSIISGAGLTSIIREGKIGNAKVGKGKWLVIEADESDGSIVQYHPEIGLLLNIEKDHQEIEELMQIFGTFRDNTKNIFITNRSNKLAAKLSKNGKDDFSIDENQNAGYTSSRFEQKGFQIQFNANEIPVVMNTVGKHNMENALAAIAVANQMGGSIPVCHVRRRRPDPGNAADDCHINPGQGGRDPVSPEGDRQASGRDSEFWCHGRVMHRQDRDADPGQDFSGAPYRCLG